MTPGRNLTFEKRMKSLDERLLALEATPRVRDAMTDAGLTPPAPPLKSASSLWPTTIRKPRNRTHKSGECHEHHSARRSGAARVYNGRLRAGTTLLHLALV
jgi:hypothetical protein